MNTLKHCCNNIIVWRCIISYCSWIQREPLSWPSRDPRSVDWSHVTVDLISVISQVPSFIDFSPLNHHQLLFVLFILIRVLRWRLSSGRHGTLQCPWFPPSLVASSCARQHVPAINIVWRPSMHVVSHCGKVPFRTIPGRVQAVAQDHRDCLIVEVTVWLIRW